MAEALANGNQAATDAMSFAVSSLTDSNSGKKTILKINTVR
jgi:hypothetical protein